MIPIVFAAGLNSPRYWGISYNYLKQSGAKVMKIYDLENPNYQALRKVASEVIHLVHTHDFPKN